MDLFVPWLLLVSILLQKSFGLMALQQADKVKTAAKEIYEGQCDFPFVAVDGGFCYFMSKSLLALNWEEAQTVCGWIHRQGHLAEFNTAEELVQATLFLLDNDPSCNSWSAPGPWIGAREIGNSNEFVWASTNTSISNDNWGPGQPNSETSGDSVVLDCEYNYEWVDLDATSDVPVLCEIPANAPPEVLVCPTDFTLVGSRCYHIGPNAITWDESVQYCHNAASSATNPKLAEFKREEELQTIIEEYLVELCNPVECNRCYWIGAEEHRRSEGYAHFEWVSSHYPITYNSWAPNRPPNDQSGRGVEICSFVMYNLFDRPKDATHPYPLCEADRFIA